MKAGVVIGRGAVVREEGVMIDRLRCAVVWVEGVLLGCGVLLPGNGIILGRGAVLVGGSVVLI